MVDSGDHIGGSGSGGSMAPLLTTAKGMLWVMLGGSGGVSGTG